MFALKRFDAVVVLLFYTFSEEALGVITIRCLLQENSEGFGRNFTYPKCLACTAKKEPSTCGIFAVWPLCLSHTFPLVCTCDIACHAVYTWRLATVTCIGTI